MKTLIIIFLLSLSVSIQSEPSVTEQTDSSPLQEKPQNSFWNKLYANGGWSLYCGFRFNSKGETLDKGNIITEHIYPLNWVIKTLSCKNRLDCHKKEKDAFMQIESDLHNMYPVWWEIQSTKQDATYGEIPGEIWRFNDCDFEREVNLAEPREIARGNIARAIFYMHNQYGLPIENDLLDIILKWNLEDLPSEQEIYRNNLIEKIQGNRNPFIDNPKLVNKLKIVNHTD